MGWWGSTRACWRMYYPVGWPRLLKLPQGRPAQPRRVVSNRDRILVAVLTTDSILIWWVHHHHLTFHPAPAPDLVLHQASPCTRPHPSLHQASP